MAKQLPNGTSFRLRNKKANETHVIGGNVIDPNETGSIAFETVDELVAVLKMAKNGQIELLEEIPHDIQLLVEARQPGLISPTPVAKDFVSRDELTEALKGAEIDTSGFATVAQLAEKAEQLDIDLIDYNGYGEYTPPSDFIPKLPFSVYRDFDGKMKHNWNLTKTFEQGADRIYYVDTVDGLDSSVTGDQANPFLTLSHALFIATDSTYAKILIIVKGQLLRNAVQPDNTRRTITNKQIAIIPHETQDSVLIANGVNPSTITWTLDNGVYKTAQTTIYNVIDTSNKDWMGVAKRLKPVATLALCTSTPNSYFTDGTSVWVNTFDGRQPDSSIYMLKNVSAMMFQLTNSTLYIRGLHIYSGHAATQGGVYTAGNNGVCDVLGDPTSVFVHNKCIFSGGGFGGGTTMGDVPSLNGLKAWDIKAVYGFNSVCAYVFRDGFNYHYNAVQPVDRRKYLAFEFECVGYECGVESVTYPDYNLHNNNATTAHEGVSVMRIGGIGYNTDGHVQADIYGCYNIAIDCRFRDSKVSSSYNFLFTNDGMTPTGKAILINCEAGKGGVYGEAVLPIYVRNLRSKKFNSAANIVLL